MTISNRLRNIVPASSIKIEDTKSLNDLYESSEKYKVSDISCEYDGSQSLNQKIRVHMASVTELQVDAIVTSTQEDLALEPFGLCKTVWLQAGEEMRQYCLNQSWCNAGQAFMSPGYNLPAKHVIHTAGPGPATTLSYNDRKDCLRQSYLSCFQLVRSTKNIRSVAFPCLGAGGAGIQLSHAVYVAVTTIREWLEQPDNRNNVDHIVLCMFDQEQWEEYYKHLTRVFPYGKDLSGRDLEKLPEVDLDTDLTPPPWVHKSNISSILCYVFPASEARRITKHFHKLVDTCCDRYGGQNGAIKTNFRTCANFELRVQGHYCILCHIREENLCSVEMQVVCLDDGADKIDLDNCRDLKTEVDDYFNSCFENICLPTVKVRCHSSFWGQQEGLWEVENLAVRRGSVCCEQHSFVNYHNVDPEHIMKYWTDTTPLSVSRDVEHSEVRQGERREPQEGDWLSRQGEHREPQEGDWLSDSESSGMLVTSVRQETSTQLKDMNLMDAKCQESVKDTPSKTGPFSILKRVLGIGSDSTEVKKVDGGSSQGTEAQKKQEKIPATRSVSWPVIDENTQLKRRHTFDTNLPDPLGATADHSQKQTSTGGDSASLLTDRNLCKIAKYIGSKQYQLGLHLDLGDATVSSVMSEHQGNAQMQGFRILKTWKMEQEKKGATLSLSLLFQEMHDCDIDTGALRDEFCIPWGD